MRAWVGGTEVVPGVEIDAPTTIVWEHDNGIRGVWDITLAPDMYLRSDYYTNDERWEVTGRRGYARVNRCTGRGIQQPSLEVYADGEMRSYHALDDDWASSFRDSGRHWLRWLRTGEGPMLWSGDEAMDVLRFALAAYASSASGGAGVDPASLSSSRGHWVSSDVVKLVFCLHRRADVDEAEFHRYWREVHGPLAASFAPVLGFRRYVQVHTALVSLSDAIASDRGAAEHFDGVAELWFDSVDDSRRGRPHPRGCRRQPRRCGRRGDRYRPVAFADLPGRGAPGPLTTRRWRAAVRSWRTPIDAVDSLILDLLEWVGPDPRSYAEVMEAWRTSCPRLPVWRRPTAGVLSSAIVSPDAARRSRCRPPGRSTCAGTAPCIAR